MDLGFVASHDTDLLGNPRTRACGPFFERQEADDGKTFLAVRPFYSRVNDPTNACCLSEFLWPVGMHKDAFGNTFWRVLVSFGHDFDSNSPDSRYRFILFPFLYTGRNSEGGKYFALFPLGGTIDEMLMQDHMGFALFPLYGYSQLNDKKAKTILWPIIGWTKGEGVEKFRVFPFYSRYRNEGRFTKKSVLWPFWTSVDYEYPGYEGGGFILFPLFGHIETQDQETWMVIPPFVRWSRNDEGHRALNCPWPFIQYSRGEIDKLYIWPLWGHKEVGELESSFLLWPIIRTQRHDGRNGIRKRLQILPFWLSESYMPRAVVSEEPGTSGGSDEQAGRVVVRTAKLWPLASYRREDDHSRFRMLSLWPRRDPPSIERNWAPLWTLYRRERVGEAVEHELLWGLFRRRRDADGGRSLSLFPLLQSSRATESRRWSLFYGLIGYERDGLQKRVRLLYFLKFGRKPSAGDAPDMSREGIEPL